MHGPAPGQSSEPVSDRHGTNAAGSSENQLARSPGEEEQKDEGEEEQAEQDLGDGLGAGGDAREAQRSRYQGDHQEDQSPFEHVRTLVAYRPATDISARARSGSG